jgi:hypothetical protein
MTATTADPATTPTPSPDDPPIFAMTPTAVEDDAVLIWSGEHHAYWRPKGGGYTTDVLAAGAYPRGDADKTVAHCGPEKKIKLVSARGALMDRLNDYRQGSLYRACAEMYSSLAEETAQRAAILEALQVGDFAQAYLASLGADDAGGWSAAINTPMGAGIAEFLAHVLRTPDHPNMIVISAQHRDLGTLHLSVRKDGDENTPEAKLLALRQALRAFPHFENATTHATPEAVAAVAKDYVDMVMNWAPQRGPEQVIQFADQNGDLRDLIWVDGEDDAHSGYAITDDATWEVRDAETPADALDPAALTHLQSCATLAAGYLYGLSAVPGLALQRGEIREQAEALHRAAMTPAQDVCLTPAHDADSTEVRADG